jgi:hypothetical protein
VVNCHLIQLARVKKNISFETKPMGHPEMFHASMTQENLPIQNHRRGMHGIFLVLMCCLTRNCSATGTKPMTEITNNVRERMEAAPVSSLNERSLFLETFLHRQRTYLDDVLDRDADADDYYDYDESLLDYYSHLVDDQVLLKSPTTSTNNNETYSTNVNFTKSTNNPISSFANYTKCAWYTLSHYIPPDSMLYDGIEGFLIALLLCLVLATCYNYCCYCCCCCSPGKKNLRKRRRRRKVKLRKDAERKRNGVCCGCLSACFGSSSNRRKDRDGKGAFTLLRTANGSKNSDYVEDDDDSSVSSIDSVLSLEYGDTHLHNE